MLIYFPALESHEGRIERRAKPRIKAAKPKIVDLETDVPVVRAD